MHVVFMNKNRYNVNNRTTHDTVAKVHGIAAVTKCVHLQVNQS